MTPAAMIASTIAGMMKGDIPTAKEFPCPACDGTVRVSATKNPEGTVSVVASCCCRLTMDNRPAWPGWDVLQSAPRKSSPDERGAINRRNRQAARRKR